MIPLILAAALTPDFQAVMPELRANFAVVSLAQEDEALIDLFRDSDPEVRRSAVRAFKPYVGRSSRNRDAVLDLAKRDGDAGVRREAIKTLSAVAGYSDVRDLLLQLGRAEPIALKALYWDAMQRSDTRDHLLDVAQRGSTQELRDAAAWGLFMSVNDNDVRDGLLELARRRSSVEAAKSLYGAMGHSDVRDWAKETAQRGVSADLREAAILLLSNRHTSDERDVLERILRQDRDVRARKAAALALGNPRSDELIAYFHLLRRDSNGVIVNDPLADQ